MVYINEKKLAEIEPSQTIVNLCQWEDMETELDEMGRFVKSKKEERWLWHAIDHEKGEVLAYVLSGHKDEAFLRLKELQPFAYSRRTITAVGKIIAEMNRGDQILYSHSQQSLYYNLRLWHKTTDKSF